MYLKLTIAQQVAAMSVGDILKRFPSSGLSTEVFDAEKKSDIDTFIIKSYNASYDIFGLAMTGDSIIAFGAPVDTGRLFIKSYDLIKENIWWISE